MIKLLAAEAIATKKTAIDTAINVKEVASVLAGTTSRTEIKLMELSEQGAATHKIVNQQRSDMIAEIKALREQLDDIKQERTIGQIIDKSMNKNTSGD